MKDYTAEIDEEVSEDERQNARSRFVLKYKILEKEDRNNIKKKIIVVYLANGKKVTYDYIPEGEQIILNLMKNNVYDYQHIMKKNNRNNLPDIVSIYSLLGLLLSLLGFVLNGVIENYIAIFSLIFSSFLLTTKMLINNVRQKRYVDFEKNMLFLLNEEMINKRVLDKNNTFTNVVSKRTYEKIVTKPDGIKGYTINSIDKMSLTELKKLLEFIRIEEQFLEEDTIINAEEKGHVKVLK